VIVLYTDVALVIWYCYL